MKPSDSGMYVVDMMHSSIGEGITGARWCSIAGVAKTNSTGRPFLVANEFICNRLAMMLGLPTPPGVITRLDDGQPVFLILKFGRNAETPPPVKPKDVVEDRPHQAAGIVAFDVWVANPDRHSGNLIYSRSGCPLTMIDHGGALFGAREPGISALEERRNIVGIGGNCLTAHLRTLEGVARWSDRIARLHPDSIEDVCSAAAEHGGLTRDQADQAKDFLLHRQTRVHELVLGSRPLFPNIAQWGLT